MADRVHRQGQKPNRFALFGEDNRNLKPRNPRKNKYALLTGDGRLAPKVPRRTASVPGQEAGDDLPRGEGGAEALAGRARPGGAGGDRAGRMPRRISSSSASHEGRYDYHGALEELSIVEDRECAEAALKPECPRNKALAILQCEAEESADGVFYPLASVFSAKLGFQLWGKCWLGKCDSPNEQGAKDLAWWLNWLHEGVKDGSELFIYVYSEDHGSIGRGGRGGIDLAKALTRHVEKVHKAGGISMHMLVDGAEGAHLPWRLQYTIGEKSTVGWKNVESCPFRASKNGSTSTIVQMCTNHAHLPGLMTGAFVTLMQQVEYISYIQMYRSMEVLLEESEMAAVDPNRDFTTRSLSSRHRAIDPVTLSIIGGTTAFIGALVAWQVDGRHIANSKVQKHARSSSDSRMAHVQIRGALRRKNAHQGQALMKKGLVFTSADFIDEDMSLMFKQWHGELHPVWSDDIEARPMALGKVPPGRLPAAQTPSASSPAASHGHHHQHADMQAASHAQPAAHSQGQPAQPSSADPSWYLPQHAAKISSSHPFAEAADAPMEAEMARGTTVPARAVPPKLGKYQLFAQPNP